MNEALIQCREIALGLASLHYKLVSERIDSEILKQHAKLLNNLVDAINSIEKTSKGGMKS